MLLPCMRLDCSVMRGFFKRLVLVDRCVLWCVVMNMIETCIKYNNLDYGQETKDDLKWALQVCVGPIDNKHTCPCCRDFTRKEEVEWERNID